MYIANILYKGEECYSIELETIRDLGVLCMITEKDGDVFLEEVYEARERLSLKDFLDLTGIKNILIIDKENLNGDKDDFQS